MQGLFLRWNHFEGALPDLSKMRNLTKLVIDGAPVGLCPVSMIVVEAKKSRVCSSCCLVSSGVDHERKQEQWHHHFQLISHFFPQNRVFISQGIDVNGVEVDEINDQSHKLVLIYSKPD